MRKIILDTDIGPDCDDAAALGLAHLYHKEKKIDLQAVVHCTSNPWGTGAIAAINRHYGLETEIGTLGESGFLTGEETLKYNRALAQTVDPDSYEVYEATALYRSLLAASDDQSIDIVAIGPLKNLAKLLGSTADEYSDLDGKTLIAKKVARLITMAGRFDYLDNGDLRPVAEWNVEMDIAGAKQVFEEWPTRVICSGFELGAAVLTGKYFCARLADDHPVKQAYLLYTGGDDRPSWDLTAVQYAAESDGDDYCLSPAGRIEVGADAVTCWQEDKDGHHYYLKPGKDPLEIARKLDFKLSEEIK